MRWFLKNDFVAVLVPGKYLTVHKDKLEARGINDQYIEKFTAMLLIYLTG
jgi:hypothetical protein